MAITCSVVQVEKMREMEHEEEFCTPKSDRCERDETPFHSKCASSPEPVSCASVHKDNPGAIRACKCAVCGLRNQRQVMILEPVGKVAR